MAIIPHLYGGEVNAGMVSPIRPQPLTPPDHRQTPVRHLHLRRLDHWRGSRRGEPMEAAVEEVLIAQLRFLVVDPGMGHSGSRSPRCGRSC